MVGKYNTNIINISPDESLVAAWSARAHAEYSATDHDSSAGDLLIIVLLLLTQYLDSRVTLFEQITGLKYM